MRTIETTATVRDDGTLTLRVPSGIEPGLHHVVVVIEERATPVDDSWSLPSHDSGPWPENLSLRREDIYDDSGR